MKGLLVARRELADLFADRSFLLGLAVLVAMPIVLITTIGGGPGPRDPRPLIFVFAVQSSIFPAFMAVNAAAATFVQDKEGHTLLPLLAAPIRDVEIVFGKMLAIFAPSAVASWLTLLLFVAVASVRFGSPVALSVLSVPMLAALAVLAGLFVLTLGSWAMVIASRVKTVRAAQQIAGLVVGLITVGILAASTFIARVLDGWLLVALPLGILAADVVALEITRRLWQREEAIARI